jgi:uncharacterized protein (TIGR02145 family)
MAIPSRQIGWSTQSNLLWQISKQLERLTCVTAGGCGTTTTTTTTTTGCLNCVEEPVVIGTQTWDKCNLNVTTYANGDPIPEVTDPAVWTSLTTGAWCYYDNDPLNEPIYGKLYNWYALTDPRGLAPVGKSIPTDEDWTTLTTFLGGESIAGGSMKETGLCHWADPNTDATNSSGFTALGGGYRDIDSTFLEFNTYGVWWASTEINSGAYLRILFYSDGSVNRSGSDKRHGFSVRCLVDNTTTTTTTLNPLINTNYTFINCIAPCGGGCRRPLSYYDVWMIQSCIDSWPLIGCAVWLDEAGTTPFPSGNYNNNDINCIEITDGVVTNIV